MKPGLWVLDPDGKMLHDLSEIPLLRGRPVLAIGPDAESDDAVMLIVPGGVIRLRVGQAGRATE
jgi:hypothetical protein